MIKLDDATISKLKASSKVSSIFDSIVQLVYNSIDANSNEILVRINFEKFFIEITDNGNGIDKKSLLLVGEW